ncbi:MAG: CD225/dispanin family protein [Dysgonomonas sp.]
MSENFQVQDSFQQDQPMMPNNNMPLAIIGTIIGLCGPCCILGLVIGIVAIVNASNVKSKYSMGDYAGAESSAKKREDTFLYCYRVRYYRNYYHHNTNTNARRYRRIYGLYQIYNRTILIKPYINNYIYNFGRYLIRIPSFFDYEKNTFCLLSLFSFLCSLLYFTINSIMKKEC